MKAAAIVILVFACLVIGFGVAARLVLTTKTPHEMAVEMTAPIIYISLIYALFIAGYCFGELITWLNK
jgi:cell shape-determining protein MreD